MGKNHFIFALLMGAGMMTWSCGGKTSAVKGDLEVTSSPTGELDGPLKVVVGFSKPMVAGDSVGSWDSINTAAPETIPAAILVPDSSKYFLLSLFVPRDLFR